MAYSSRASRGGRVIGVLFAVACGNGDDLAVGAGSGPGVVAPDEVDEVTPPVLPPEKLPEDDEMEMEMETIDAPERCVPGDGVSGSPETIPEVLELMNSLPRPTSLACFVQSLDRPLRAYMTSSSASLQPSPGARSPRTFLVNGPLAMSIVFEGVAHDTLEIGFRSTPGRSIKTEILFPLEGDVTVANYFDRVMSGAGTVCGACHVAETRIGFEPFPGDVFESEVLVPISVYEVYVSEMFTEEERCMASAEPARCELLSAVFDHGEVFQASMGADDPP